VDQPAECDRRKLLSVKNVAKMCGCSVRHVYHMADTGLMPSPVKLGFLSRWSDDVIREWIGRGCPACGKENAKP
jgi:predicted DNA-binding transcriptional regulator AlpA